MTLTDIVRVSQADTDDTADVPRVERVSTAIFVVTAPPEYAGAHVIGRIRRGPALITHFILDRLDNDGQPIEVAANLLTVTEPTT